ncbi:MAG: polyhydroxyalkanoic acid system family protein [Xanthomonadales bacterium]|jgi:putative polyhydroxyalkanoate system protein|nr:polyhydroxyalkanoic acid system family protein [Xanthomonadales bacterium]
MSHIDMRARHSMSEEDAQVAADKLAGDLANKFDIDYGWDGDHIHFERPGVHGMITVRENEIRIKAVLGLMLIFLKQRIEDEIVEYLETHFGCSFD